MVQDMTRVLGNTKPYKQQAWTYYQVQDRVGPLRAREADAQNNASATVSPESWTSTGHEYLMWLYKLVQALLRRLNSTGNCRSSRTTWVIMPRGNSNLTHGHVLLELLACPSWKGQSQGPTYHWHQPSRFNNEFGAQGLSAWTTPLV